jgi:uncharacterized protein YbjT (DUF2867 family)
VDYLQASGVPSIVLRPTFYTEILLGPWIRPGILEQGLVAFPLPGDLPMSWISATELAGYSLAALDRHDLAGRTFDIGGPEALTGRDLAACLSEALGRSISFVSISPDDYESALVLRGAYHRAGGWALEIVAMTLTSRTGASRW